MNLMRTDCSSPMIWGISLVCVRRCIWMQNKNKNSNKIDENTDTIWLRLRQHSTWEYIKFWIDRKFRAKQQYTTHPNTEWIHHNEKKNWKYTMMRCGMTSHGQTTNHVWWGVRRYLVWPPATGVMWITSAGGKLYCFPSVIHPRITMKSPTCYRVVQVVQEIVSRSSGKALTEKRNFAAIIDVCLLWLCLPLQQQQQHQ